MSDAGMLEEFLAGAFVDSAVFALRTTGPGVRAARRLIAAGRAPDGED
jgi:hypothetical protein